MRPPRNGPLRQFLEAAVASTSDECIVWPFVRDPFGYGKVRDWRKPVPAVGNRRPTVSTHRLVWELANGCDFPEGLNARHLCGNGAGSCVNPRHITPGTTAENNRDTIEQGRQRWNPWKNRQFTNDQVRAIRNATGRQKDIAIEFGTTPGNVSRIRAGKRYADVV